ncbi:MAG: PASTA domain-containing protein [Acidimicrobiales bacterium]
MAIDSDAPTASRAPTPTPTMDLDVLVVPPVIGLDLERAAARLEDSGLVAVVRMSNPGLAQPRVYVVDPPEGAPVEAGDEISMEVGEASDLLHGDVIEATVVEDFVMSSPVEPSFTAIRVELPDGATVEFLERRSPMQLLVTDWEGTIAPLDCEGRPLEDGERVPVGSTVSFRFVVPPGERADGGEDSIVGVGIRLVC